MKAEEFPRNPARAALYLCACAALVLSCASAARAQTPPVLLTEGTGTTTRAVAYDAVTFRSEPFNVTSPYNWNADKSDTRDQRTRVIIFARNLSLLAGEGASALTADAQDASGRLYPLKVEALHNPKYVRLLPAPDNPSVLVPTEVAQPWLYAVTLRLDDAMTDTLGDVLVRVSLHGVSSNRVRLGIGQSGAGVATDPATEFISPAPAVEPTPLPPLAAKAYGPGEASVADITRLLEQATWGPKGDGSDVARVQQGGIRAYVEEQFNEPVLNFSKGSDFPDLTPFPDDSNQGCPVDSVNDPNGTIRNACLRDNYSVYPLQVQFHKNALARQTQLRQRVAWALHQIFVVSQREIGESSRMTAYLQLLDRNAFGNFKTLLTDITLNPAMGEYLNMNQSVAGNPNENYAREVLQLFSVGVNQLNLDGTPVLDSQGNPVPTYTQTTVNEFTRAFTGWSFNRAPQTPLPAGVTNFRDPMVPRAANGAHDTGAKTLFATNVAACQSTNGTQNAACAQGDMNVALDVIFNHPNVGPFVSKQLIQHLVTSNPTPAYVARVASVFNDECNGLYPEAPCTHARGNMKAVVRAILLDPEARGDLKTDPSYGRLREPVQYVNAILRAHNAACDGVLGERSSGGDMPGQLDQPVFQPPTVFSYYSPDYEVPGAKTTGPAFQILYTTTTIRRANVANRLIYSGIAPGSNNPTGTTLMWAELNAIWDDTNLPNEDARAAKLIDVLDMRLLHGTMSAQMRAAIKTAMFGISSVSSDQFWRQRRSQMAAYLILTSPHYDVQR
ncbi:MAG TPA: DUF1800 domain-containing protein [Pyrinomonadaceae bacterium]|jgi:uncharacterized protein (DUF1800 family)|nr:DUF1800 domain-containing protein [Pyrinomonadaceae bacterium]